MPYSRHCKSLWGPLLVALASAVSVNAAPPAGASPKILPTLLRQLGQDQAPVKAWVFFSDKGVHSPAELAAALQQIAASYDARAVQRRLLRGDATRRGLPQFDERDLRVARDYIAAVASTGARVHVESRWLNAVSVYADRTQVEALAALRFVARLEAVGRGRLLEPVDERPVEPPGGPAERGRLDYGLATAQLNQINVIALHDAGFSAQGVIVGVLDTGFHRTHAVFHDSTHPLVVVAEHDFINNDDNTDIDPGDPGDQHHHGTMILGTLAAYRPGELVGTAYNASFILCKTEDLAGEYPAEEDNYVAGLEFIEQHGGDLATSSLGYIDWYTQAQLDGQTAVTTIAVNIATANGLHCCTAAGNSGHDSDPATSHLLAPSDAFRVLTSGAADSAGNIAGFSSDGPTADGRVKPELLARGVDTYTISPDSDTDYGTASGTSLSTPLLAGAVACLVSAHPDWTVDEMRAGLFATAGDYVLNHTFDPLYIRGYGFVNALACLADCNGNHVPDSADIAAGTSQDANSNGVPDECEGLLGDLNCDGLINAFDIDPFVLALTDTAAYATAFPNCYLLNADCNRDGVVNAFDIDPFIVCLTSGCP